MSDTPRTDKEIVGELLVFASFARKLERELAAVTEERDELKSKYRTHHDEAERITNEIRRVSSVCRELREQRDKLAEELDALKQSILDLSHPNMKLLLEERNDAKEQRDRLAEACKLLMRVIGDPNASAEDWWATEDEINAAWNSGSEALAAVKGGSHE